MVERLHLINRKRTYRKQNYDDSAFNHPAKMHPEIAQWLIRRLTKKGELIFDPFAGIGTTLIEGMILGRNVMGVELEKHWVDSITASCEKQKNMTSDLYQPGCYRIIHGDSTNISFMELPKIKTVITSPPYGIIMHGGGDAVNQRRGGMRKYDYHGKDKNPNNSGNFRFGTKKYEQTTIDVYNSSFNATDLYGNMAILTKNFYHKGEYTELWKFHKHIAEMVGWKFLERFEVQLPYITQWQKVNRDRFPNRIVVDWEDIIILKKVKVQ